MPAQRHTLAPQCQLHQQVVAVGIEKVRRGIGAGFQVDVMEGQPHVPVHMLGHLRAAIGAEVQHGEHAGLSRRHLERLFRRHVQATPPRYYLELRLPHARQLLQHTNKSLTEVAVASGFVRFPHFYLRFRELFAIAPQQYRVPSQGWSGRQDVAVH